MHNKFDLYLASRSPRRRELLTQVGLAYSVVDVDINESVMADESAEHYVLRLAEEKALAGWDNINSIDKPVLGADTAVVINDVILGKPRDHDDAIAMLSRLSGKTHQVVSGVALVYANASTGHAARVKTAVNISYVRFAHLSEQAIEAYWQTGECKDKAGAYAIQGYAAAFIEHLSGSYSGVMGLPLYETVELLREAGISKDTLVVS